MKITRIYLAVVSLFILATSTVWAKDSRFKRATIDVYIGETYEHETIRFQHLLNLDKYAGYSIEGLELYGRSPYQSRIVLMIDKQAEDEMWFSFGSLFLVPKKDFVIGQNFTWLELLVQGSVRIDTITVYLKKPIL